MTLIDEARKKNIAPFVNLAEKEKIEPERLMRLVANGRAVIPCNVVNKDRDRNLSAIGEELSIKVNANIGTSTMASDLAGEVEKAKTAEDAGAHAVMDLSTAGDLSKIRKVILGELSIPLGTVPIYEAFVDTSVGDVDEDVFFRVLDGHLKDGVDFVTIHAGVTTSTIEYVDERTLGIVSRGGSLTARWMVEHGLENPYYEHFDYVLERLREYDVTLSLGDGLRPGCISDASDAAELHEQMVLGHLVKRARAQGVQVMVEGPGHVPLNRIGCSVRNMKQLSDGAPIYLLGPLPTDVGAGYDHIVSAIGASVAGMYGADFICMCTAAEHLALPDKSDIREAVYITRIAAHIADITRREDAIEWDNEIATARAGLSWGEQISLAIDPVRAATIHARSKGSDVCSMCGELCAIKQWLWKDGKPEENPD